MPTIIILLLSLAIDTVHNENIQLNQIFRNSVTWEYAIIITHLELEFYYYTNALT
jgi:hypothetical protein